MSFRGEMNHGVEFQCKGPRDSVTVADIAANELIARIVLNVREIFWVRGVCELIEVDDLDSRIRGQKVPDESGSDEPCTSSDKDFHGMFGLPISRISIGLKNY